MCFKKKINGYIIFAQTIKKNYGIDKNTSDIKRLIYMVKFLLNQKGSTFHT